MDQRTGPAGATAKNIGYLGHSDQGGRADGTQVMVHKGHAYVGHMFSDGITAIDVRDPRAAEGGRLHRQSAQHALASHPDA